MTVHDIVDGTIITNPSFVYPQILEYILLLPFSTETIATISKYYILTNLYSSILLGVTFNDDETTVSDITSAPGMSLILTSLNTIEPTIFSSKYILYKILIYYQICVICSYQSVCVHPHYYY